jgi:prepilin-type N-terminal cleavage/methylation domain-containing protein
MKYSKTRKAFSLIELSIVILIIGILVVGITQSSRLIEQFKLSAARSLTQNSPVASIADLALWLETTLAASFDDAATEDGTQINSGSSYSWRDINPQSITKNNASSVTGATYTKECLNDLPCLRFNGTSQYFLTTQNGGTSDQLTIFVVFSADALGGYRNFIATSGLWYLDNMSLAYGLNTDTNRTYYRTTNGGSSATFSSDLVINKKYIAQMVDNGTTTKHYVSGVADTSTTASHGIKSLATLAIGAFHDSGTVTEYFDGDIGEIIIFTRALKESERIEVEEYLSKKWEIAL